MDSKILVSVIIPTYKRPWKYLNRSLDSVLKQTYPDIEIIVVNDSPKDYEYYSEINGKMKAVIAEHPNVKYLENDRNIGVSLTRNRGIEAAAGSYITFLDDDDEYLPQKVEHQLERMLEDGGDLSFEDMIMYNTKGDIVDVREYADIRQYDNDYLLRYHLMHHMTGTPTFMLKRERILEIGCFDDEKLGEEFLLMLKAIRAGFQIKYYPVCDVRIYKHEDGEISSGIGKISGENKLYRYKKQYFPQLKLRERRTVRFRHYAVMVVAYLRNRMPFRAFGAGVTAFFVSPLNFFVQVAGFFKRRRNKRKE